MNRPPAAAAVLAALLALAGAARAAPAQPPSSARIETDALPGLHAPADIEVDPWGIAHIHAGDVHDAFFLQGFNAARDRLWQIDLWRKRGLGLLSASFGPAYAAQDRAARLFLYRGDMAREWAAYGPDAKADAEAFVAGIDAYVAEVRAGRRPLPVEFKLTGSAPDLWTAEDVVRIRSHGLTRNLASEVARAQVACAAGLSADRLRQKLEPPITPRLPAGLDPCDVPPQVMDDYRLGAQDVSFAPPGKRLAQASPQEELAEIARQTGLDGSNNWVIAGARTATGRPILANDPHRALGVPSLRYIVQLSAPGLDVIGAGEPALPGVSIGHNDRIAFGLTIFGIDQEDLYVYDLNPANPHQYRYQGRWEDMTVVHQPLKVKGEADRQVELLFTRHGPVLYLDAARHHAFALRSVWSEPGTSAYFGSSQYMTARDWSEFHAAMAHWGAPSENLVYADVAGHIGWIAGGRAPIRPNWDGLTPAPGDGRYEWAGFWGEDDLPQAFDPPAGWWASANEMNLPPGYPAASRKIGFEWADRSRIDRIKQVLAANDHVTLADAMALQGDDETLLGKRLAALAAPLRADDPETARALALLRAWDGREGTASAAAAIYEVWGMKHLGKAVVAAATPKAAQALVGSGSLDAVVTYLESPEAAPARDALLLASLKEALDELTQRLGPDMATWSWGRLHHVEWTPAAAALADPALKAQMSVGPLEAGGSASTPMAQAYRLGDFSVTHGASFRMVLDVGDWDNSRAINTPGQSGDPFSPQYRDLFVLWNGGQYVPLLYSRAAVDAAARLVIRLTPAG
ncbi:MAG: penicillin acylase family protein [Caulobacteraceae bacterium]|nr:penicillin acylase family protein [Caulobacteraceae bacterium]